MSRVLDDLLFVGQVDAELDQVLREALPREHDEPRRALLREQAETALAGWLVRFGEAPIESIDWKTWLAGYIAGKLNL